MNARPTPALAPRRTVLAGAGTLMGGLLAGCLAAPADGGGGPTTPGPELPFETVEVDDGPLVDGGLTIELDPAYYATLVTDDAGRGRFDFDNVGSGVEDARTFVEETDLDASFLLVIQAAALNSSMELILDAVRRQSGRGLTVSAHVEDPPPHTDDWVITTLIARVDRVGGPDPTAATVTLDRNGNEVTFEAETGVDPPGDIEFTEGFETGLDGWERDADVPEDPNDPGNRVEWSIRRSTDRAASGSASAQYVLDGRQDDGTIWLVRPVAVEPGRAYDATVTVRAWSASESFNTLAHLVAHLGPDRPTAESSFPRPMENSTGEDWPAGGLREPLNRAEGWESYRFTWASPSLETDRLYLAVGISAVWETQLAYYLDDVTVTLEAQ